MLTRLLQTYFMPSLLALALAPPAISGPLLEEVVVTAARTDQRIAEVPSNITVLGQQDLALVGHTHISELMNRVAGAWISRGNGQEHLTALRSPVLTGAGACGAFLLAQDGIPLRASGFCNVNELFDANSEQAGRIEVIKGPGSALYGSNAMHGMINIITPPVQASRSVSLEGGPNDYVRGRATLASDTWRLDVNGTRDGGYKEDSGYGQQKFTLKHRGQVSDWETTSVVTGANLNQETAGFIVGNQAYKDPGQKRVNPNPEAYRDTQSLRLYSQLRRTAGQYQVTLTPYARYTKMAFIQHFLPGQAIEENGHNSIGLQFALHNQSWTFGFDGESTRGYLRETQPGPTIGSAFLVATIPPGKHYDYDVDATTLAAFARYQRSLADNLDLTLGLRAERVNYDYDNLMQDGRVKDDGTPCGFGGCRFSRPMDRSDTFTNLSPRLGLTWSLDASVQAYLFASRGFRAPQVTELYRLQDDQQLSNIDSESLSSLEAGLRGTHDRLTFDMSAYLMRKDNFIFRDTNRRNVDNGETSHRGLELSLALSLTNSLTAALNWSYAIHRYENTPELAATTITGNDIDTAPRHLGAASLQWSPGTRTRAELEWVHMGEYFEDPENQNPYEGHDLFHLRVTHKLNEQLEVFGRVTNLTDVDYAERADFAFGNDRYFVGEPRSVFVGITAGF
ncbi:MAG: TonB-dependent receptor [Pseudomonadota bacterium]